MTDASRSAAARSGVSRYSAAGHGARSGQPAAAAAVGRAGRWPESELGVTQDRRRHYTVCQHPRATQWSPEVGYYSGPVRRRRPI